MNKKIVCLAAALVLCCTSALMAQEKSGSMLSAWITSLQQKIDQIIPKKDLHLTTGVAGTRGAKEETAAKLYWKGKKGEEAVTEEELHTFKAGLELAFKGDRDGSIKALDSFMKQYPDSALIPDAKKTLDLVKADTAPEKKAEPVIEKKEKPKAEPKIEKKEVKKEVKKPAKKKVVKKAVKKEEAK